MPLRRAKLPSYYSGNVEHVGDEEFKELLGREIPKSGYNFYKKNRMVIHENCTVADLRYSRRWVGRLFSGAVRFAIRVLTAFGNKTLANTLVMGCIAPARQGPGKIRRNVKKADGGAHNDVQRTSFQGHIPFPQQG